MAQSLPSTHIEAHVGNVSGGSQVAIGNYIVQIGRVEGGVVNILNEAPPPPKIRPQPVLLRQKPFPGLLDREAETTTIIDALKSQQSVECSGAPGSGKTSLVRHVSHQSQLAATFSAGVVYFPVNQQSADDLLKSIFDAFYICEFPIKPNETEIRHYLQPVNALVLLDDIEIDAEQISSLMNVAPGCTFVAVTKTRSLLGETVALTLKGLPTADAVSLFQKELGRSLLTEEENGARAICESVDCIPLLVLRAAHETREQNRSLLDVVSESKLTPGDQRLAAAEIKSSSADERKVLAVLAVFAGTAVAAEHVAAVAGVADAEQSLDALEQRGLVQSYEHRYTLASDVNTEQLGDLKPWFTRALNHFVSWTEQNRNRHKLIATSGAVILLLLKQAVGAGLWNEVRRLGHATEEALTTSGKWDMWANVLQSIGAAAEAQGDVAERAWVLHQLGTRALCLEDRSLAESALKEALGIRERLNDVSGAAVTRHNLNILLHPVPETDESSDDGGGGAIDTTPVWLKVGALIGLAILTGLLVWRFLKPDPVVIPAKIASLSVSPTAIEANGVAQLCYEVENAASVRIEPNIGERKPASKECMDITASETVTYTLTAFATNGSTTSQQVTLSVPPAGPPVEIVQFRVQPNDGPSAANGQFELCYHVRNAAHAEIDNNIGAVALEDQVHCRQITAQQTTTFTLSATGSGGHTIFRRVTAQPDPTLPPVARPQILSFRAAQDQVVDDGTTRLCYRLKDANSAQLDPGARTMQVGAEEQCVPVKPLKTTTYTLRAFNSEGVEAKDNATITVIRSPKILEFAVNRQRITRGESVSLCFRVENADSIGIEPSVARNRAVSGSGPVCVDHQPGATTTYSLTAFNDAGLKSPSRRETVTVDEPKPKHARILFFNSSASQIRRGQRVRLCYGVEDAITTTISPLPGVFPNSVDHCLNHAPPESITYVLKTTGEDGQTESHGVSVAVEKPPEPKHARILFFDVSPSRIKHGQRVRLCYGVADANRTIVSPLPGEFPNSGEHCFNHAPRESITYILKTTGEDGQTERREASVAVEKPAEPTEPTEPTAPPVRITRFEINPTMVHGTQLCYALENARSAFIDPGIGALQNLTRDCPKLPSLERQTYTLSATGADGKKVTRSVTYTPPPPPKPLPISIVSFSGPQQPIKPGAEAKLCYRTLGEGTAKILPMPGAVTPSLLRKCVSVFPEKTMIYELIVTGPQGQTSSRRVTVTVERQVIIQ